MLNCILLKTLLWVLLWPVFIWTGWNVPFLDSCEGKTSDNWYHISLFLPGQLSCGLFVFDSSFTFNSELYWLYSLGVKPSKKKKKMNNEINEVGRMGRGKAWGSLLLLWACTNPLSLNQEKSFPCRPCTKGSFSPN